MLPVPVMFSSGRPACAEQAQISLHVLLANIAKERESGQDLPNA
jgi:hypothetical protein